jgi:phage terminase large subunit-like protein
MSLVFHQRRSDKMSYNIQELVYNVTTWFNEEAPDDFLEEFLQCPRDQLHKYHHTVGREIRNKFGLWQHKWEPNLIDGVDYSEEHPDALSMRALQMVWDHAQSIINKRNNKEE